MKGHSRSKKSGKVTSRRPAKVALPTEACQRCLWPELAKVSDLLNASIYNLEATLTTIVDIAIRLTYASRGFILLYQEGPQPELVVQVGRDRERRSLEKPEDKLSWSIVEEVIQSGKAVVISDLTETAFNMAESVKKMNLLSVMCVPLKIPRQGIPTPDLQYPSLTLASVNDIMGVVYVDKSLLVHNFTEEELSLFKTLANNATAAIINAKLFEHYLQKKVVEQGLKIAQEVQAKLLPRTAPKVENLDVAFLNLPCHEAGGNYYDFIFLAENKLALVLGSTSGHSLGAAILMASARSFLLALLEQYHDIQEVFFHLNNLLKRDTDSKMVMSLFIGLIDTQTRILKYINAGPGSLALIYHRSQGEVRPLQMTGQPLGLMWDVQYEQVGSLEMANGDILLLSTDSIWRLKDPQQQPFKQEQMRRLILENQDESAAALCEVIQQAVDFHTDNQPRQEDLTVIVTKARAQTGRLKTPRDFLQSGLTYMKVKNFDKAILYFKKAKRISPTPLVEVHFALGIAYLEKRMWHKARRQFENVRKLKPDFPNIERYAHLAQEKDEKQAASSKSEQRPSSNQADC